MTAEEKAKELVNKFTGISGEKHYTDVTDIVHAKQCALIAVNEILDNFGLTSDGKPYYCSYLVLTYYMAVKSEIDKL
jgi:hypothetical protein